MTWRSKAHPPRILSVQYRARPRFCTCMTVLMIGVVEAPATATLFECVDSQRRVVFTDSPHQLLACRALDVSSLQHSPPASVPTSVHSTSQPDADATASSPAPLLDESEVVTVPIEHLGNILVVSATLNESRQARFIVDTGASQTIISQIIAFDLGLYSTAHPTQVMLHTAGGTVQADSVVLDSLRIAGAEVRNSQVLIHDLPDLPLAVDGLLGLSFLGAYQVTLDAARGELRLRNSRSKSGDLSDRGVLIPEQ